MFPLSISTFVSVPLERQSICQDQETSPHQPPSSSPSSSTHLHSQTKPSIPRSSCTMSSRWWLSAYLGPSASMPSQISSLSYLEPEDRVGFGILSWLHEAYIIRLREHSKGRWKSCLKIVHAVEELREVRLLFLLYMLPPWLVPSQEDGSRSHGS